MGILKARCGGLGHLLLPKWTSGDEQALGTNLLLLELLFLFRREQGRQETRNGSYSDGNVWERLSPATCTNMEASGAWGGAGNPRPPDRRPTAQDRSSGGHPVSAASIPRFSDSENPLPGWAFCWLGFLLSSCFKGLFFPLHTIDALAHQAAVCLQAEKCTRGALGLSGLSQGEEGAPAQFHKEAENAPRAPRAHKLSAPGVRRWPGLQAWLMPRSCPIAGVPASLSPSPIAGHQPGSSLAASSTLASQQWTCFPAFFGHGH